jgi:hypothetical protein
MDSLTRPSAARSPIEIAETFPKAFGLALVEHGTRCGKAGCRCARGDLHPTAYLRWRVEGRQRRRYVRRADLPAVRAAMGRRRAEYAALRAELAESVSILRALKALCRDLDDLGIPREDRR